jgi:hypothetical protein
MNVGSASVIDEKRMNGFCTMLGIGNYGRFCNGASQVAGVLGIARKNNLTPGFPLWRNSWHKDAFGSSEDIDIYKHLLNPLPLIPEGVQFTDKAVEWGYHDIKLPSGNWNLSGHFQSLKYFDHCLDEVRWHMRMKDEPPENDYCAIHYRAGDYDGAYHPRLSMNYYEPAMKHFGSGQKFLVFSDDIDAARGMFGDTVEYSEGRDYLADFKLLKNCAHFIIGNSYFSAMAAILAEGKDKKVIAPDPWFGPKYTSITGQDIYCDDWIIIKA